jgi:hypothetical protein
MKWAGEQVENYSFAVRIPLDMAVSAQPRFIRAYGVHIFPRWALASGLLR